MTSKRTAPGHTTYEIVVRGELHDRFAATFLSESLAATIGPTRVEARDGRTAIVIEVIDQSQLLAVLARLGDLALEIERVNPAPEHSMNTS